MTYQIFFNFTLIGISDYHMDYPSSWRTVLKHVREKLRCAQSALERDIAQPLRLVLRVDIVQYAHTRELELVRRDVVEPGCLRGADQFLEMVDRVGRVCLDREGLGGGVSVQDHEDGVQGGFRDTVGCAAIVYYRGWGVHWWRGIVGPIHRVYVLFINEASRRKVVYVDVLYLSQRPIHLLPSHGTTNTRKSTNSKNKKTRNTPLSF
jgi:hypothetical protein